MLDVNMIIANNIQAELKKENKKQVDLAEGIGVSKQTMSKIMNGARAINAIELHKISEYLHVSMDSLMKMPEKPMDTNVIHAFMGRVKTEEARKIVRNAEPAIMDIIAHIKAEQPFAVPRNNLYDRLMSGPVNPIFYHFFVKSDAFRTDATCVGCGQCVKNCPLNNITLKDRKPVWGKQCTHCMACICYCPTEAIEYGKKSVGKPRYHFEQLESR